jgi:hypothetical protein
MPTWDLDDPTLEAYIKTFFGHGHFTAKYWFIGMEFGGGSSVAEIVGRISRWHRQGGHALEDLNDPPGSSRWFRPPYPLQPTWRKLIRILLSAEGFTPTSEHIRAYQKDRLGGQSGLDCLLELLPLPSPGLNRWLFYPEYSSLPYLRDRATYLTHVTPSRIKLLHDLIVQHNPPTVLFYGSGYGRHWRAISGLDFEPSNLKGVSTAYNCTTLFVSIPHATARGLTNEFFNAIGRLIHTYPRS